MRTFQSGTFSASRSFRRQLGGVAVLGLAVPGPRLLMDNSDGNTEVRITLITLITTSLRPRRDPGARKTVVSTNIRTTAGKPSE